MHRISATLTNLRTVEYLSRAGNGIGKRFVLKGLISTNSARDNFRGVPCYYKFFAGNNDLED